MRRVNQRSEGKRAWVSMAAHKADSRIFGAYRRGMGSTMPGKGKLRISVQRIRAKSLRAAHQAGSFVKAARKEDRGFGWVPAHSLDFIRMPIKGCLTGLGSDIPHLYASVRRS